LPGQGLAPVAYSCLFGESTAASRFLDSYTDTTDAARIFMLRGWSAALISYSIT